MQYVVNKEGKIHGAEAVSRWQDPQEGLLTPAKYLDVLSRTGMIHDHDYFMFGQVCEQLEKWEKEGISDVTLSCNFTRFTISDKKFLEDITRITEKYSFNHNNMVIEITENALSDDRKTSLKKINGCKDLGFPIVLDDIGGGDSSLIDLYDYPIDCVKVERKIILNALDERGKKLLDGIIVLAHGLGIEVLCEGVETEEQNEMVLSTDCDLIQGFYYSRVLPQDEANKFLKENLGL